MLKTIRAISVQCILLESVPRLASHNRGKGIRKVIRDLKKLGFNCSWKIYDTHHFGLPQLRPRLYIAGLHESLGGPTPHLPDSPMVTPVKLSECLEPECGTKNDVADLNHFCIGNMQKTCHLLEKAKADIKNETYVLDIDASFEFLQVAREVCPALTESRARGYWLTSRNRRMTSSEEFRVQGFPVDQIKALASRGQIGKLAGGAMSVPVVSYILESLLLQMQLDD